MHARSSYRRCSTLPLFRQHEHASLSQRYLAFLWLAFHDKTGRFRNFLSYDRDGKKRLGRRTAMGVPYGHWERCWAFRKMPA